jgi:hypothetical protein
MRTRTTPTSAAALRCELEWLRSRYDSDKVSPAIFAVIKAIEHEIAWIEHCRKVRS